MMTKAESKTRQQKYLITTKDLIDYFFLYNILH